LLETAFFHQVSPHFSDSPLVDEIFHKRKAQPSYIPLIQLQVNRLEQKRRRLEDAFAEGLFSFERYRQKLGEMDQLRAALCEQMEHSGAANAADAANEELQRSHLLDIKLIWDAAAPKEKKHLVSLLVKRIEAEADQSKSGRSNMIYRPVLLKSLLFL
jgi:hypothetical protein